MRGKMIYTVTCNPALDYCIGTAGLEIGAINKMLSARVLAGGKGLNVSTVLNHLGVDNIALGFIAGFTGREIRRIFEAAGGKSDFIELQEGFSRINVKLRDRIASPAKRGAMTQGSDANQSKAQCLMKQDLARQGSEEQETERQRSEGQEIVQQFFLEETEINGAGPKIPSDSLALLQERLRRLEDGDILVLSGSVPESVPESLYGEILEMLSDRNVITVVDAAKGLLSHVLPYHPFLVKPNIFELRELFGATIQNREEVVFYAKKLQKMGAENVLVSMGADGALLLTKEGGLLTARVPEGEVKNSVGAGDSMVAGFIAGWCEKKEYVHAFKMGLAAGSASAFSEQLATGDEIEKIYHTLEIHDLKE